MNTWTKNLSQTQRQNYFATGGLPPINGSTSVSVCKITRCHNPVLSLSLVVYLLQLTSPCVSTGLTHCLSRDPDEWPCYDGFIVLTSGVTYSGMNEGIRMTWGCLSGAYEEIWLLGYNIMQCTGTHPTFRRNILPPSSGSKNNPSMKSSLSSACYLHHSGFMLGLFPRSWSWRPRVSPECRLNFNALHDVISQKVEHFNSGTEWIVKKTPGYLTIPVWSSVYCLRNR
jgi:hypothetical protein